MFSDENFKNEYFRYFGYGFIDDPGKLVPNVPLTFYSFHLMVGLGFYFLVFFIITFVLVYRGTVDQKKVVSATGNDYNSPGIPGNHVRLDCCRSGPAAMGYPGPDAYFFSRIKA